MRAFLRASPWVIVLLSTLGCTHPPCHFHELEPMGAADVIAYKGVDVPWEITARDLSGFVTVSDRRTGKSCRITTDSDSRPRIYASDTLVAVRITEITSDDIVFYAAATCQTVTEPPPIHLGANAGEDVEAKLRDLALCTRQE